MAIENSCFISYCHGQHTLMRRFIDELREALNSSIEPYLDERVYVDDRLVPGYRYNEELAGRTMAPANVACLLRSSTATPQDAC